MRALFLVLVGTATALTLAACSSEETPSDDATSNDDPFCGPADTCPPDVSNVDLTTPVSFKDDVFPIIQRSCNNMVCHGTQGGSSADNWLGPPPGNDAPQAMLNTIVAGLKAPSATAPAMDIVKEGDWQNSFLMLKVDGCQDTAGLECEAQEPRGCYDNPCGASMPNVNKPEEGQTFPLPVAERNIIRAWIAQGAKSE
jgi:hypothetical protein